MATQPAKNLQLRQQHWTRPQALRQCGLTSHQLTRWENAALVPRRDEYTYAHLLQLKVLARLKELGYSGQRLHRLFRSISAKLPHESVPLAQLRVVVEGRTVHVLTGATRMEALSGQLLFNFGQAELQRLIAFPPKSDTAQQSRLEAESWFQRGLELEQSGASGRQAIEAYEKAIALCPTLAGALVNIGTIFFHARKWKESEKYYQRAITADASYPLAHFNLANLHEELGRTSLAIQHYKKAIELQPSYADAHYNLALLFQTRGRAMEALRHWKLYLALDPNSQWSAIARRELAKLRENAVITSNSISAT